jgi:hypothetical protein
VVDDAQVGGGGGGALRGAVGVAQRSGPPCSGVSSKQEVDDMQAHPALVLNADFRPVFKDHVSVVAEYDKWVSSPSTKVRLPSVVALRDSSESGK